MATRRYRDALDGWSRLISKYPQSEEASLALYRTGIIQSERLGELDEGLETFRRLTSTTGGSWAVPAKSRVTMLSEKSLGVATERTFRTNEQPVIKINSRNFEKLKFSQYALDLEAYFRKTHHLGRVDALDVDLIQPDKTWEVTLQNYEKYRLMEENIPIPFDGAKPGVCIVKVEAEDWEATTLVIRSDIDVILKSSKREVLVFAEDRVRGIPAANTDVYLSDGKRIFATGKTGEDGVFRGKPDELKDLQDLRLLAKSNSGVATNLVPLGFLSVASGLQPRGYIYTDKSAYRPGEKVAFRGIIRHVADGSYAVPKNKNYTVRVNDPSGRLIDQFAVELNDFGSFTGEVQLPLEASLGGYAIHVTHSEKKSETYPGSFQVQEFQLQRIQLSFDLPQNVYFRGETVEATIEAKYYWGTPAANKLVHLTFPDGRQATEKTDAEGKISFEFDTSGFQPGRPLPFSANIPELNITKSASVFLAELGFTTKIRPAQDVALSGEPFEVEIKTRAADGKEISKELTLMVLRRELQKTNRVLEAVPWINYTPLPAGEVTVEEHKLKTDDEDGVARLTLRLNGGGEYVLRVSGQDPFGQSVSSQSKITISDDEDANKLRFFAPKATYEVGSDLPLRLHSRLDKNLALITFEGEEIIEHRVVSLKQGHNPIELNVGHAHFPNFRVSVALMDGQTLRASTKNFNVTRELNVANEASPGQALSPRARLLLRRSGVSSKCCFIESAASGGELDPWRLSRSKRSTHPDPKAKSKSLLPIREGSPSKQS